MKIKKKVLQAINTPQTRRILMDALNVTEFTIARYIQGRLFDHNPRGRCKQRGCIGLFDLKGGLCL